jgi:hypothetical protein
VLRAGLSSARWITVDDTGARHKATNGFCTQTGNAHFAWFGTTGSKSRLNFLELLRAGHEDHVINAEALAYMRGRNLARNPDRLARRPGRDALCRSQGVAGASRPSRYSHARCHARSRGHRHRRRALGQHQGARLPSSFTSSISTSFSTPMLVAASGQRSRQEWRSRSSATILSSLMVRKPDCT